ERTCSRHPPKILREADGGKAQTFVGLYQHFPADRSSPPGTASRNLDGGAGGDARNAGYVRPLPLGSRRGPDAGGECVISCSSLSVPPPEPVGRAAGSIPKGSSWWPAPGCV